MASTTFAGHENDVPVQFSSYGRDENAPSLSTSAATPSLQVSESEKAQSLTQHTLRSSFQYSADVQFSPRNPRLYKLFNEAYVPFSQGKQIPEHALAALSNMFITSEEFLRLVVCKELTKGRYVYLKDGRIGFNEFTIPPHGEVIGEVLLQIGIQDRQFGLFESGSGNGRTISIYLLIMLRRRSIERNRQTARCALPVGAREPSKSQCCSKCIPDKSSRWFPRTSTRNGSRCK